MSRKEAGKNAGEQKNQVEQHETDGLVRHTLFGKMKTNSRAVHGEGDKTAKDKRRQERKKQSAEVTKKPSPALTIQNVDDNEESSTSSDQCDDGNFDYCTGE